MRNLTNYREGKNMKIIDKNNFISVACISFTLVVCGKLLIEKIAGIKDEFYTENIFMCLGLSILITLILAAHYYLQRFPVIPVIIGQYIVVMALIFLYVKILSLNTEVSDSAYFDMFRSVTVPYIIAAAAYYISFFMEVRKANKMIEEMNGIR